MNYLNIAKGAMGSGARDETPCLRIDSHELVVTESHSSPGSKRFRVRLSTAETRLLREAPSKDEPGAGQ